MRKLLLLLFTINFSLSTSLAQKAVIEDYTVDINCDSPTHAIQHFRTVTTILNEHGSSLALFVCSSSKIDKLISFKGMVNDSSGRMIRKFKESELKRTEFSPYLAIDECRMYLDYTPPVYPITITYEWTIDSKDNRIEFPPFNPLTDYDVCVKHASYRLKAPKSLNIRHAMQNINGAPINVNDYSSDARVFSLELHDLPMLKKEPYARPFHERIPVAWFAPSQFTYYGIQEAFTTGEVMDNGNMTSYVDSTVCQQQYVRNYIS